MSLFRFLSDVEVRLTDEFQDISPIKFGRWDDARFKNDAPPRILWVPHANGGDTYGTAKQTAGISRAGGRSLFTSSVALQIRIWGEAMLRLDDDEATEYLKDRVIVALHTEAYGSLQIRTGQWAQPSANQRGRLYVLEAVVDVPVLEGGVRWIRAGEATVSTSLQPPGAQPVLVAEQTFPNPVEASP